MEALNTQPFLTYGTQLVWAKTEAELETATRFIDIREYPDMGGAPAEVDVTTLMNKMKVNIPGLQSISALEFPYFVDQNGGANMRDVMESSGQPLYYMLKIGVQKDGKTPVIKLTWRGTHTTWTTGASVDGATEATLSVTVSSDITTTFPTLPVQTSSYANVGNKDKA